MKLTIIVLLRKWYPHDDTSVQPPPPNMCMVTDVFGSIESY